MSIQVYLIVVHQIIITIIISVMCIIWIMYIVIHIFSCFSRENVIMKSERGTYDLPLPKNKKTDINECYG